MILLILIIITALHVPRMWSGFSDKNEDEEKELIEKAAMITKMGKEAFEKQEARKKQIRAEFENNLNQLKNKKS